MAPKGHKRGGSSHVGRPSKHAKMDPVVADRCSLVAESLPSAALPHTTVRMLVGMVPTSLGVFKDQRDSHQDLVVVMLGETLAGIEATVQMALDEAQAKVDGSAADKAARDQAQTAAAATLEALNDAVAERKLAVAEQHQATLDAQGKVATAKAAQQSGDAELLVAETKKQQLEDGKSQLFVPLKDNPKETPNFNKVVKSFEKLMTDFGFDSTLVGLLPGVLKKDPGSRGSFDNMAVAQCEAEFVKRISSFEGVLTEGEAGKLQREAVVAAAQGEADAAREMESLRATAFDEAVHAQPAGEEALEAAKHAVKDFFPEFQRTSDALDEAKAEFETFREGPLAAYAELSERSTRPPEPVAEEATSADEPLLDVAQ